MSVFTSVLRFTSVIMDIFWSTFPLIKIVVTRQDGDVEPIVVSEIEKEIIARHGNCGWMALCLAPAPPSSIATVIVVFTTVGDCALSPLAFLPTAPE